MTSHASDGGVENILEAVLTDAFSPPPSRRQSVQPALDTQSSNTTEQLSISQSVEGALTPAIVTSESSISSGSNDDSWKAEYESQVETWRAQSSEAREKAEQKRERWEAIRAAEQAGVSHYGTISDIDESMTAKEHQEAGWETVTNKKTHPLAESAIISERHTSSLAHPRDSASESFALPPTNSGLPTGPPTQDTGYESQKWEDIQSSITSSLPSMTYPERTDTPSPLRQHPASAQPAPSLSPVTLAIFDSTLSTRTRVTAVFSSLAINMLLPFVNGVMLGFGEIFAKNILMEWLGWRASAPGSVAATAGIGVKPPWGQRQK